MLQHIVLRKENTMRSPVTKICTAICLGFGFLVGVSSLPAVAQEYNNSSYDKIAALAKEAEGSPVSLTTNYWLAWTGAWDTVVMKETGLWKKWLPKGSEVTWVRNLQGPPVITDLIANKQQIGYLGDNPALVATTKRTLAPINLVAINETSPGHMCGSIIVRSDAPNFKNIQEAAKWLNGKVVAVPKGSCADRLGQYDFQKLGINVTWQQMQPEVCVTALQAKKVDAASLYEPHASKAVMDGFARYAISANAFGENDADGILMRKDFIDQHRTAAIAWLKADIEALYFMRDHPIKTVDYVKQGLPGYTRENLWNALYGARSAETGASNIALRGVMVFTPAARQLLERSYSFLHQINVVQQPQIPQDAIETDLVVEAFKELNLDPDKGLFEIPASDHNPFKGDDLIATQK
jgi:sulfonate transport system substrate-binding protein